MTFILGEKKHYIYFFLMFFLPLWLFIDNVLLIVLFAGTIFLKEQRPSMKSLVYYTLIVFFAYIMLRGIFSDQFSVELGNYKKILPLILIPFGIASLRNDQIIRGLYYLFFGILIMQIIAIYGIVDYYFFSEGKKIALRNYAKVNEILRFERPYVGYFSSLGFIISYVVFKQKKYYLTFLSSAAISILLVIIISARLALMIILISFALMLIHEIKKTYQRMILLLTIVLLGLALLTVSDTPIQHRFSTIKYDARIVIWEGAANIFKENSKFIFGLGGQQVIRNSLLKYYKEDAVFEYLPDKNRFIKKNYNTHNQYLNEVLRGGLIGTIFYLLPFILLVYKCIKLRYLMPFLLLFSIMLFGFVENILDRQVGVYLAALILSITNSFINDKIYT